MLKKDSSSPKPRKWYNSYKFPLVPLLRIRKANEHNTGWFSFQWLFFQVWSRDAFDFEIIKRETYFGNVKNDVTNIYERRTLKCKKCGNTFTEIY